MASQIVPCQCGRKLRVEERHAGKTVRCPGCRRTFPVPAPAEEDIPDVLPADSDGPDDEGGKEKVVAKPRTRKAPRPAADRDDEYPGDDEDVDAGDEEEPRPRKKRRPRPTGIRGFFVSLSSRLQGDVAGRLLFVAVFVGVGLLVVAVMEGRLMGAASATPQTLPLARLAANGPGDNAHVIVTDFLPGDNFVYEYRGSQSHWQSVYVPVVPLTQEMQARLGPIPMGKRTIPPGSIRVIVHSSRVHSQADLPTVFGAPTIQGTVVNSIRSLDNQTQKLLRDSYPGTDFGSCYILQEGRKPSSAAFVILMATLGTLALVISGLLLAIRYLFRSEV
jgi:hypothetical protein